MAVSSLTHNVRWRRVRAVAIIVIALVCAGCIQAADSTQLQGTQGEDLTPELSRAATTFVVKFAPSHPLGRAEAMQGLAAEIDAGAAAHSAVESLPELDGLCFERFTQAAGEVVLSVCELTSLDRARDVQALWLTRLASMQGIEHVAPVMSFAGVEQF